MRIKDRVRFEVDETSYSLDLEMDLTFDFRDNKFSVELVDSKVFKCLDGRWESIIGMSEKAKKDLAKIVFGNINKAEIFKRHGPCYGLYFWWHDRQNSKVEGI